MVETIELVKVNQEMSACTDYDQNILEIKYEKIQTTVRSIQSQIPKVKGKPEERKGIPSVS